MMMGNAWMVKGRSENRFLLQVKGNSFIGRIMPIAFLKSGIGIILFYNTFSGVVKESQDRTVQHVSWRLYIMAECWGCGMKVTWQTQLENNSCVFSSSWILSAGWATEVWYLELEKTKQKKNTMSVYNSGISNSPAAHGIKMLFGIALSCHTDSPSLTLQVSKWV